MTISRSFPRLALIACIALALTAFAFIPAPASADHEPGHAVSEPSSVADAPDMTEEEPGGIAKFFRNIGNGFKKVGETVAGWFKGIGRALGLVSEGHPEGASCEEVTDCARGLACLNTCFDDEGPCDTYEKLCQPIGENASIAVKPRYASCGAGDLCEPGTACTRTCPEGIDCEVRNRCLSAPSPVGSCTADTDCSAVCGAESFPPIGPSAFVGECRAGSCVCMTEEVQPNLRITSCDDDALERTVVCPTGTRAACTKEGCEGSTCPVRLTCLTAPAYGGQCLRDSGCRNVSCSQGSEPFCDTSDNKCRCRSTEHVSVSCTTVAECGGVTCDTGQDKACIDNVCACEKKTVIEEDFVCTADSQCPANCPEGFSPACVDGGCACQRTRENVPVSCSAVSDCAGVSCPEDFEKICLDGTCACTRTTVQE